MSRNFIIPAMLSLGIAGLLSGCSTTPKITETLQKESLQDGAYQGYFKGGPNTARVEVTIRDRDIVDVDAVSGATNSSHVIVNAIQQALNKACGE